MVFKQILLAFVLFLVSFVMEVSRNIITGDQPRTLIYGSFLWILLFVSAQPPFLNHSLRKLYKLLALIVGFVAGVVFDALIGPLLLYVIFVLVKAVPHPTVVALLVVITLPKVISVLVGYLVSKAAVRIMLTKTGLSNTTTVHKDDASPT